MSVLLKGQLVCRHGTNLGIRLDKRYNILDNWIKDILDNWIGFKKGKFFFKAIE